MSVLMEVRVQPRASKERIASLPGGGWKAYVYAAPVDGKTSYRVALFFSRMDDEDRGRLHEFLARNSARASH